MVWSLYQKSSCVQPPDTVVGARLPSRITALTSFSNKDILWAPTTCQVLQCFHTILHFTMPSFLLLLPWKGYVECFVHFKLHFHQYSFRPFKIVLKITVTVLLIHQSRYLKKKKNLCPRKCPLFSVILLDYFPPPQTKVLFFSEEK